MEINVQELRARLEAAVSVDAPAKPERMTVHLLAQMYLAHAQKEYNGQYGHKEVATIKHAFGPLVVLYGESSPAAITPLRLRAARQLWIEQRRARTTIQARMQRLRKAWRWARQVGLIDTDLPDIGSLRYGHAPEPEKVKPVDIALVEATLAHVSPRAKIMLKLMLYTGMRPGEVCAMRADEIDTTVQPWVFRPKHHKTAWKGCKREIFIGPKAQMLIQTLMIFGATAANGTGRNADVRLMTASCAAIASTAANAATIFKTQRGNRWTANALYMAVFNACRKHGLPHWHPNQLRHTVGTMVRHKLSLEHAQAVLGHADIDTTQIYAERNQALASQAMAMLG